MKRLNSSDSLGGVMSICQSTDEKSLGSKNNNLVYSRGFQSMLDGLDEEDCLEESGQISEKKRRLSVDQVKALEKNFEVENKLEPERKVKLAQELGLQPRQVAVWFQNRRARWKTKQLERDYGILKANYDSLKQNFEALQHDKEALLAELKELKSKQGEESTDHSNVSIKEEIMVPESENKALDEDKISATELVETEITDLNQDFYKSNNEVEASLYADFKDGSSDSDSSAIFNDDNSLHSSSGVLQQHLLMSPSSSSLRFSCSSPSSINGFQFADSKGNSVNPQKTYQTHQFVKMEEHNFFGSEEPCNFFSEEQAPTLQWYCPDQWN
ncbi:hypothetical protein AQUCO_01000122v1 [Aquilegia coerulea]|uniref:Homeobox-leucine zipper protein n=1 Tax=Aquilegia coerulea TaxID=218851 RepID=A0A2G5E8C2_AQUCA|nr:hypothetical protein AQUCO_01000122v1 [Aquilegia coerulea]PIA52018.1 hypothetical protein AQUCO_01000122v1 [Aquilegia coerulea]PIA52019.1 hypothetical protein AQUCO_01000122v1 [Aquilegia coerulea]